MANGILERQKVGIARTLLRGIIRGHWTMVQLDQPSAHWRLTERDRITANARIRSASHSSTYYGPPAPFVNLAREYLEANPSAWDELLIEELNKEDLDTATEQTPLPQLLHA